MKNCHFLKLFVLNNQGGTLGNLPRAALHFATKGDPWYFALVPPPEFGHGTPLRI